MAYDHLEIEARWQRYWDEHGTFRAKRRSGRPKRYVLDMFPYPSGVGLHVGHPEGYTATDIMARAWRMRGYDVLHPMGWDAFGLPAEQHAIETGQHPAWTTANNIATFKRQLKMLGFSYDWSREIDTTDPGYVRWTQWIFLQLFRRGLAYQATVPVNWCPALGTVLANEEVVDGESERGRHPVYRTPLRQWMLKITAYADRLAEDLALVDWPEGTLTAQRRWIRRSGGAEILFGSHGTPDAPLERPFGGRRDRLRCRRSPGRAHRRLHDAARYPHGRDLRRARARARADAHVGDAGSARGRRRIRRGGRPQERDGARLA